MTSQKILCQGAEAKIMLVTDPWPDKNAINDAIRVGIPIIALCDTNNQANNIDLVIDKVMPSEEGRLSEAVEAALSRSKGLVTIILSDKKRKQEFMIEKRNIYLFNSS